MVLTFRAVLLTLLLANPTFNAVLVAQSGPSQSNASLDEPNSGSLFWFADGLPVGLDRWSPNAPVVTRASIIELTSKGISFQLPGTSETRRFDGDRVVAVEVDWKSVTAKQAHKQFVDRDYANAVRSAAKALEPQDLPYWQQQILKAEAVECARGLDRIDLAGKFFLELAATDPPTFLYAVIPLYWANRRVDPAMEKLASEWIKQDQETAKLMGASWLLSGSERSKGIEQLKALQASKKGPISQLASAQLWRVVPPTLTLSNFNEWQALRNKMPFPLQLGPTELIADKLAQASQPQLAIPEWLRIALLYSDRTDSVSKAVASAVEALRADNRPEEADRVRDAFGIPNSSKQAN